MYLYLTFNFTFYVSVDKFYLEDTRLKVADNCVSIYVIIVSIKYDSLQLNHSLQPILDLLYQMVVST